MPYKFRQAPKTSFGQREVLWAKALLRPINSSRTRAPYETVLHIHSHNDFRYLVKRFRSSDDPGGIQIRPTGDHFASGTSKFPPQSSCHSESAVVGCAASKPHQDSSSPFFESGEQNLAQSVSVQIEGVIPPGGQHGQPKDR